MIDHGKGTALDGKVDKSIKRIYNLLMSKRGVAQLVAHLVWDQDAAGSNPVTPTIKETSFVYLDRRRFF